MRSKDIMQIVDNSTNLVNLKVNIDINHVPNDLIADFSYLKFGLIDVAFSDYKWDINVTIGGKNYQLIQEYITSVQYNVLPLQIPKTDIKNGNTMNVNFAGHRIMYDDKRRMIVDDYTQIEANVPGRLVFASLLVRYSNS